MPSSRAMLSGSTLSSSPCKSSTSSWIEAQLLELGQRFHRGVGDVYTASSGSRASGEMRNSSSGTR
jgi:hypothetical protein